MPVLVLLFAAEGAGASRDSQRPTPPSNLVAAAVSHNAIQLTWSAASDNVGVASYLVYRNGGSSPVGVVAGTQLAYVDGGRAPSTTYRYTVRARDAAGNLSYHSNSASAKTSPLDAAPPTVVISVPTNGTTLAGTAVVVSGNAADDVAVSRVDISVDGGAYTPATGTSSWTYTTPTLASGPHTITARATDSSGKASALASVAVTLASAPPPPNAYSGPSCTDTFAVTSPAGGATLDLPVCTSRSLTKPDTAVTRVVVVVHGDGRDAPAYYRSTVDAAVAAGAINNTLVIAPHFMTSEDVTAYGRPETTLYWSDSGWKIGGESLVSPLARPWTTSSYTALDQVVAAVSNRAIFPNLRDVVVAGHSAGGQFVNRYAAGTRVEQQLGANGNRYRYVVANPSSYLYLSSDRPVPGSTTAFAPPSSAAVAECSTYNRYRYGLEGLNTYMRTTGAAGITEQYRSRNVAYLLGDLDTDVNDASLDTSCAANMQGAHRLARGTAYFNYLGLQYGAGVYERHQRVTVANVGHSGSRMLKSPEARPHLFG